MTERVCAVMMAAEFTVTVKHCMTTLAGFTAKNEDLVHDRGKVYYDPRGDYSYDEAKMNAAAAAFNARYAQAQPAAKKRVKLKHAALVNGIIMAEVLGKLRALNPYEER